MTANVDQTNGIHYGVIPKNDLFNCAEEFYNNAEDKSYKQMIKEMRESITETVKEQIDDMGVQLEEITSLPDLLDKIEQLLNDKYENECANMVYEKDGYIIQGNNDDPDLFVIKSPVFTIAPLCSPCAPNAGYLRDAVKTLTNLKEKCGVLTYCLEDDWFNEGKAPYIYRRMKK